MRTFLKLTLLCLILSACSDNGFNDIHTFVDDKSIQTINGTWRLISFEDLVNKKVELNNETNSRGQDVIITLDDTMTPPVFSGVNTTNRLEGGFEYISTRQMKIQTLFTTEVVQPDWGNKFSTALVSGHLDFIVSSRRLRFYYDNRLKSMTFEKQ